MGKRASTSDYDAVIIGAGLIGLSAADSLLARGLSVCVTDINAEPMRGASFCNSGMIHPSQAAPWAQLGFSPELRLKVGKDVLSLANRSAALIAARAKDLGLPQTDRAAGCLQIFQDENALLAASTRCTALAIAHESRSTGALVGGKPALFYPQDSSGNARDYGMALAADITARGGHVLSGEGAAPWMDNGRVIGIRLGSRDIRARQTVLAAGMQSQRLAARIGLDLPMKRVAGWALNYAKPQNLDLPDYPVMEAQSCSAMSIFDDVLRLSGTLGEVSADTLIETWTAIAPNLMSALGPPLSKAWTGDRPVSLTGKPFIGRSAVPGLWVNTAHGHMGWTLCAGSGELLADMIVDGTTDERFSVPDMMAL